jgi:hypothetical protein
MASAAALASAAAFISASIVGLGRHALMCSSAERLVHLSHG